MARGKSTRACVLVLGDIGRSPRMQYHAKSLADMKRAEVDLVGYDGAELRPEVDDDPRIRVHHLHKFALPLPRLLYMLFAPIKVVLQVMQLFYLLLFQLPRFDVILVQNPPGLPALIVVRIATILLSSRFIIDWHNFGYTLLALKLGGEFQHPFVVFSKWYEKIVGRMSDANICVTRAMAKFLDESWGIQAIVLHDKPPQHFQPLNTKDKHWLYQRLEFQDECLSEVKAWLKGLRRPLDVDENEREVSERGKRFFRVDEKEESEVSKAQQTNSFTYVSEVGSFELKRSRPAVIVSSTSYTPDEDFTIMLDAITVLDDQIERCENLPPMLFVVTGEGPMKDEFIEKVNLLQLRYIKVLTAWLKPDDYPKMLGSADVGISLHTSSSGLDLPMKVVDMFGCELPVCAHGFECVDELVSDGKNGYIFNDYKGLASCLQDLLSGFPHNSPKLQAMRGSISRSRQGWSANWNKVVKPLVLNDTRPSRIWVLWTLLTAIAVGLLAILSKMLI
ncbi:hypothetical protein AAMO2058_000637000 [Amorphochlora amoebiformis]